MGGQDLLQIIELILQSMIKAIDALYDLIANFFDPDQKSQDKQRQDYERISNNYVANMSPEDQAKVKELADKAASLVKNTNITGEDIVDYIKLNQEEKVKELQKDLKIKDNKEFKPSNVNKEEFVQKMTEMVKNLKPFPVVPEKTKEEFVKNAFVTKGPKPEFQQYASVHKVAIDGSVLKDTVMAYYTESETKIPAEILVTGNTALLDKYIKHAEKNKLLEPGSKDMLHLKERLDYMTQINAYSQLNNCNKDLKAVQPGDKKVKGHGYGKKNDAVVKRSDDVIPGVKLGREQDTSNGCWSCAMEVLLSGQGVQLDQSMIRAYKPDYVNLGDGPKNPKDIDVLNSDSMFSIHECSELVGKVSPNTMVNTMSSSANSKADMMTKIDSLIEDNVPVAYTNGSHWKTIIGQDKDNYFVIDSMRGSNYVTVPKKDFADIKSLDCTWMEKMQVNEKGEIMNVDPKLYKVDPKSGAIIKGDFKQNENALEKTAPMQKDGNFFESKYVDAKTKLSLQVSTYLPKMHRNYEMDYSKQLELVEAVLPSPKEKEVDMEKYEFTSMSSFNKENTMKRLEKDRNNILKQHIVGHANMVPQKQWGFVTPEEIKAYEDLMKKENKDPYTPVKLSDKEFKEFYGENSKLAKEGPKNIEKLVLDDKQLGKQLDQQNQAPVM